MRVQSFPLSVPLQVRKGARIEDRPKMVSMPTAGMVDCYIEIFIDLCQTDIRQNLRLRRNAHGSFRAARRVNKSGNFMRLVAENLAGERGGEILFSGLNFAVAGGEALTITGPNGAGKSTLLRIIAGLLDKAEGRIRLDAAPAGFDGLVSACHYLGHLNAMKPVLSVEENLRFWQSFSGIGNHTIGEALDRVQLGDIGHLPFGYLSTGQKRRASIARLLISHRPVWLLDEPTAGLDKGSEDQFAGVMRTHLSGGGIVVAATHLPLGLDGTQELVMGRGGF